jgi:hypothetical protein
MKGPWVNFTKVLLSCSHSQPRDGQIEAGLVLGRLAPSLASGRLLVFQPALGGFERDDTDRVGVLAGEQVLDHGLQVGGFLVGLGPGAAEFAEVTGDQIERLIGLVRHDRRRPVGPTHDHAGIGSA